MAPGFELHEHMSVWDADGEAVGTIRALGASRFFIARGPALTEYVASHADILEVGDEDVFLEVPRAALIRLGPLTREDVALEHAAAPL